MRYGYIRIDEKMLLRLLKFPDARVVGLQWDPERNVFLLGLEDEEFPEIGEGMIALAANPIFTTHSCGHKCELGFHDVVTRVPLR